MRLLEDGDSPRALANLIVPLLLAVAGAWGGWWLVAG